MHVKCAWMWCDLFFTLFYTSRPFCKIFFRALWMCVILDLFHLFCVWKIDFFLKLFLQKKVFDLNCVASWILMFFYPIFFLFVTQSVSLFTTKVLLARECVWTLSELNERESSSIYGKTSGVWSCFKLYTNLVVAVRANCSCCCCCCFCDSTFSFPPFSIFLYRCTQRKIWLTIILRNYIAFLCGFSLLALFLKLNNVCLIFSFRFHDLIFPKYCQFGRILSVFLDAGQDFHHIFII